MFSMSICLNYSIIMTHTHVRSSPRLWVIFIVTWLSSRRYYLIPKVIVHNTLAINLVESNLYSFVLNDIILCFVSSWMIIHWCKSWWTRILFTNACWCWEWREGFFWARHMHSLGDSCRVTPTVHENACFLTSIPMLFWRNQARYLVECSIV